MLGGGEAVFYLGRHGPKTYECVRARRSRCAKEGRELDERHARRDAGGAVGGHGVMAHAVVRAGDRG